MQRTIFSTVSALTLALVLSACGSNVALNTPPVEDKSTATAGSSTNVKPYGASSSSTDSASASASGTSGPVGVDKLVYFDFDSAAIKSEFRNAIEANAKFLAANKSRKIAIEGHADERGGREYNLALGQKRSEAVRRAMGLLGVPDAQAEAVSFGKEKPAVEGNTEEAYAKNRRAEIAYEPHAKLSNK